MQKMRNILFLLLDTTQSSIFWQLSLTMSRHAVKVRNQEEGTQVLTDKYIVDVYTNDLLSIDMFILVLSLYLKIFFKTIYVKFYPISCLYEGK